MGIINRNNYESFIVDFWDGILTPEQEELLKSFLNENPDLRKDILDEGHYNLPELTLIFENKQVLMKSELNHENIDEFLVAEMENELLPHQKNELNRFIANYPRYERDRKLYALTKLIPDKGLIFPWKKKLKRGNLVPLSIRYAAVSAAAIIVLGIGIWLFNGLYRGQEISKPEQVFSNNIGSPALPEISSGQEKLSLPPVNQTNNHRALAVKSNTPILEISQPSHQKVDHLPVKDAVAENFYSYSKTRKPDDFLSGLVNSYLMPSPQIYSLSPDEPDNAYPTDIPAELPRGNIFNGIASRSLKKLIKDTTLAKAMDNQKYSLKTKVAKALAWATGKASQGTLRAEAIPNIDGSLSAMSFTRGKYNYVKRF